jgi:hypothetical protein
MSMLYIDSPCMITAVTSLRSHAPSKPRKPVCDLRIEDFTEGKRETILDNYNKKETLGWGLLDK